MRKIKMFFNQCERGDVLESRYYGQDEFDNLLIEVKNHSKPYLPNYIVPLKKGGDLLYRLNQFKYMKRWWLVEESENPKIKVKITEFYNPISFLNPTSYIFNPLNTR